MNYRHAFHAGNFADVVKHAVLVRILVHLRAKPAAFRVIDTHAGAGRYDLTGPEAARSLEWREGIERLVAAPIGEPARTLLAPYLDAVAAFNGAGGLTSYPGSPALVRAFLRPQDRLLACELEPNAAAALARYLAGDRAQQGAGDRRLDRASTPMCRPRSGAASCSSIRPSRTPAISRASAQALEAAHRKWAERHLSAVVPDQGARAGRTRWRGGCGGSGIAKILRAELSLAGPRADNRLGACGLIVVNPPWTLADELAILLPELAAILSGAARRRPPRRLASQAKSSFATFPQPWISIFS